MGIVHHYSNAQGNATGTLTVWNGATTASVNATDVVRPQDWNSAHDNQLTLVGANTANNSTVSGTNVVYSGMGGVTLVGSNDTLGISAVPRVTDLYYPPFARPLGTQALNSGTSGGTGGSTQFTVSGQISPIYLPNGLSYNSVEMVFSGQATSAGTGSASNGYMVGLYTNNAGTLSLLTSYQFCHVMSQNSVTAQSHSWWFGTNSTSNSSSVGGNVSASFTVAAQAYFTTGANSLLTQGTYYQFVVHTKRTSSVNVYGIANAMCVSESGTTVAFGDFGGNTAWKPPMERTWFGIVSTTMNAANTGLFSLPNAISSSAITNTANGTSNASSLMRLPYVKFE